MKTLRVPHEPRFVTALALAVEPADALSLLLQIKALRDQDLGITRRVREALRPAYEQAAEAKDWDAAHGASVLIEALGQPDHQAYLAYQVQQEELTPAVLGETLATVGCAAEDRKRPWSVDDWSDFYLNKWRERVRRLFQLRSLVRLLPAPGTPQPPPEPALYTIEASARLID
jgi:hypothetical protein